jgi:cholesterol oxidase
MDYDVIVIGSGFGGAITSCRLAEAGMKVLILERGRWWDKKASPGRTAYPREAADPWIWDQSNPDLRNGWADFRVFPNMTVVQGAAVGGGSLIYANISAEAPKHVFGSGWPAEITYDELKPYYDKVGAFMNVQKVPQNQWPKRTDLMLRAAQEVGQEDRFQLLNLAVSFDENYSYNLPDPFNVEAHSKRFTNDQGEEQGTCVHLGNCVIGCEADAKNTLDRNYIPAGMKHGLEVRPLHLVKNIEPVSGGYKVSFDELREGARFPGSLTAARVIVAAGSLGSTELLLRARDVTRTLPNLSSFLGRNWSSNGDFLTPAFHPFDVIPTRGPTITSAIDYHDASFQGQRFWVQDGGFPDLAWNYVQSKHAEEGMHARARILIETIKALLQHSDPLRGLMPWFAQGIDAGDGVLRMRRKFWFFGERVLHLDWDITQSEAVINAIVEKHKELAKATDGNPIVPPTWTIARDLITPHPLGGCNIGTTAANGVVNHAGQVFGYPGLYVCDGAVVPEALGVNPSRTIGALAERTAALILAE